MTVIGIDPGINGAIAVLTAESLNVYDFPILESLKTTKTKAGNRKKKKEIDIRALMMLFFDIGIYSADLIVIEKVGSMPGQGVSSMFSFGQTLGRLEGVVFTMASCRIEYVAPAKWKKYFNLTGKGKDAAVIECRNRYPDKVKEFPKSKDGRADAALMAEYGKTLT